MSSCVSYCRQKLEAELKATKLAERTLSFRQSLVKFIAPKLYSDMQALKLLIDKTPRPAVLAAKKLFRNKPVKAVEIGVSSGLNSLSILSLLNVETLWLVDPYETYDDSQGPMDFSGCEVEAHRLLAKFEGKVEWLRLKSEDAAPKIPDGLDLVYVDGNHTLKFIREDIRLFYPKVRQGGVLGGHDFNMLFPSVPYAVNEFARFAGLVPQRDFFTVTPDWWFIKK